LSKYVRT